MNHMPLGLLFPTQSTRPHNPGVFKCMKLWALETNRQKGGSSGKPYMFWMQRGEIQEAAPVLSCAETEKVVDLELSPGFGERQCLLGE